MSQLIDLQRLQVTPYVIPRPVFFAVRETPAFGSATTKRACEHDSGSLYLARDSSTHPVSYSGV